IVDLVSMKALRFEGDSGERVVAVPIPDAMAAEAEAAREEMLDGLSMFSDELTEAILEERVTEELILKATREATIKPQIATVLVGSAYKNKGLQPLLDAIPRHLPAPSEVTNRAVDLEREEAEIALSSEADRPLVMLAFKLEDGRFGQLTYLRVY